MEELLTDGQNRFLCGHFVSEQLGEVLDKVSWGELEKGVGYIRDDS